MQEGEDKFQTWVVGYARVNGWLVHHVRPAWTEKGYRTPIQGDKGFPDLVLCRPPELIIAELKSQKGKLSEEQKRWIGDLQTVMGTVACYVWRPKDRPAIEDVLGRRRR